MFLIISYDAPHLEIGGESLVEKRKKRRAEGNAFLFTSSPSLVFFAFWPVEYQRQHCKLMESTSYGCVDRHEGKKKQNFFARRSHTFT
jgi:hypothetical protein